MKIWLALVFTLLLTNLAAGQRTAGQRSAVQPIDGADCSNLFFKALLEKDAATLNDLLAPDFTVTSFQGQEIEGSQLKEALANGFLNVESGMLSGTRTRIYGDVNIITGQWNVRARIQNHDFQGDLAYLTVCVRSGGKWKVSAVQLTPVR